jgi:hypothetical protein
MPTDHHGQTHSGAISLFDDPDEHATSIERSERHERERLESAARRLDRRSNRQYRKDVEAAEGKSKVPSWLIRLFGKKTEPKSEEEKRTEGRKKTAIPEPMKYIVVRRPATPEPVYTAEDIDPVDSPWLRECGMVRVRSDDAGGCHIVPKSSIQKND